ncbi:MAG: RIP metalloprotease RseP [Candidatus Omnitrophica bacterium]|nr:RIP metalloprotease RseP [Candidatus Omnitrophota bacterium]
MITLLIFLAVLSLLIVVHEFGHFLAARLTGVRVEKFSLGFGTNLLKKKKGHTEYSISAIPLGGYVKLAGDNLEEYKGKPYEYLSKPISKRFYIIFCGPLLNYVLGFLFFWLIFFVGYPSFTTKVGGLLDGYGAKKAGLQIGDKITAIDGQKVAFWEELQKVIQEKNESNNVNLTILRDSKEFNVSVAIRETKLDDQLGSKRKVGLLGITPFDEIVKVRHGFFESFVLSLEKTWFLTEMTYKGLWRMVTGKLSVRDSVTGPLGIFDITSKAAKVGLIAILQLVAVLSISLGIFNLLPLPVLDGGHIFLLGIEKIRGKYLGVKAERVLSQTGFVLIISLALFVTYNDIMRMFGEKIVKFFK